MTHLSFSARSVPARCAPFAATLGVGLLLAGVPASAATIRPHPAVGQAGTGTTAGHGGKEAPQTWTLAECMSMVEEDPFGARDYAQDWMKHGGDREARHCHALALLELGDELDAAQELDDLVRKAPPSGPESSASLRAVMAEEAAEAWLSAGNPPGALNIVDYGLSIRPGDTNLRLAKARALLEQGNTGAVVTDLTALVARGAEAPTEAFVLLASAERRLGQLDKATQHITLALQRMPDDAGALLERGIIREQVGDATGAQADWQHVLDLSPDSHEADLARQDLAVLAADPDSP
ncbi:tetratricopeptide repeat protein [Acetobacter cerevisiae]|uniref:Tetratricopeptide repeat protein n=1 Tax=Acetobacter cerevisiae TaxID=178900 RepID=A0ABT1EQT1_9PROT|nr:tetratricopeptide repeat protein [Acetobacter cerevisiae]MCP1245547.1 tetratricopeptide repeat protein [Acetobacter cerevisiae]MCP1255122.1 tetratricopeptide repeat protein [Acetobacter cerevisiae]